MSAVVRESVTTDDGVRLAVVLTGEPRDPVWLHAHGVGSSGAFVQRAFGPPVHDLGWRLATYDLRGHGDSGAATGDDDYALDRQAEDLVAVAGSVGATVVGGVSLGAHAAVRAAAELDLLAVVACLPAWSGASTPGEGPHAAVAQEVRTTGVAAMVDRLRADAEMASWLRRTLVEDFSRCDPGSLAAALVSLDGAEAPDRDELAALPCPSAVVGWPDDPGHPLDVARDWARWAGAPLGTTTIPAAEITPDTLGHTAVAALTAALNPRP